MSSHLIKFNAIDRPQNVEVGFNFDQPDDNKEIIIAVYGDRGDVIDEVWTLLSTETATKLRDHLTKLLELS